MIPVWVVCGTFCAIDSDSKLGPSYKIGKCDGATANAFMTDLASPLRNRIELSIDGLAAYYDAVELTFGADVDYSQVVKTYVSNEVHIRPNESTAHRTLFHSASMS